MVMSSDSAFLLRYDLINSYFLLSRNGEPWLRTFASFGEAYNYAEKQTVEVASLILHNMQGDLLIELMIAPLPQQLLSARKHWMDLARSELLSG